ncbi:MAG: cysteine hydrolase [Pelosinus sp.]|nr:cysteine hydrolase [Pelosinus sp.]
MDKALIVIDYTYDFVAPNGALTCGLPGQQIEGRLAELINQFAEERQFIVIANDIHHENDTCHPESKLFPPHNLKDSQGCLLYGKVKETVESLAQSKFPNLYMIDKTRYSAFAGTDLALRLRERNIKELHLTGVCTDICVLHTAIDAYNLGFDMVVHADAVASFNQVGHEWALNHFARTLGAMVITKVK